MTPCQLGIHPPPPAMPAIPRHLFLIDATRRLLCAHCGAAPTFNLGGTR